MTFSLGLAPTKVLAKVASKWQKPAGFTIIPPDQIGNFLENLPCGKIWGIGPQSARHLESLPPNGIKTAQKFVELPERWVLDNLPKSLCEIYFELNGISVYEVADRVTEEKSVQRTRSFSPSTNDQAVLLAELSAHVEDACVQTRMHGLLAREISFFLKTKDFVYHSFNFVLPQPTNIPSDIMKYISQNFREVFKKGVLYRTTGVTLMNMVKADHITGNLFNTSMCKESENSKFKNVYETLDKISRKHGSDALYLASSMKCITEDHVAHKKHLILPFIGYVY